MHANEEMPKAKLYTYINGLGLTTNTVVISAATAYGYPAGHIPVLDNITLSVTGSATAAGYTWARATLSCNALGTASASWSAYLPFSATAATAVNASLPFVASYSGGLPLWAANAGAAATGVTVTGVTLTTVIGSNLINSGALCATIGFHFENPSSRN